MELGNRSYLFVVTTISHSFSIIPCEMQFFTLEHQSISLCHCVIYSQYDLTLDHLLVHNCFKPIPVLWWDAPHLKSATGSFSVSLLIFKILGFLVLCWLINSCVSATLRLSCSSLESGCHRDPVKTSLIWGVPEFSTSVITFWLQLLLGTCPIS